MTPLRRLLSYFAKYRRALTLGGLCVVGSAAFSLLKPMIVGNAVDVLTHGVTRSAMIRYGLLFVGAAAVEGGFLYLQRWIIIGASRDIEFDMRNDFYEHLQRLPVSYYQGQRTGDLMSRATNDLASVRMLIGPAVMHSASSLLIVIGAFVMMMRIDHALAFIALLAVPVIAGLVQFSGTMTIGAFVAFQFYLGRMVWPLIALGWVINLVQRGMASMTRLHEVWSIEHSVDLGVEQARMPVARGDIDIRDLTFTYTNHAVLRDIDLRVRAGETIGIVGRTASGKSTR